MIAAYYSIRGWPVMLASSERGAFLKKVHAMKVGRPPARCSTGMAAYSSTYSTTCPPPLLRRVCLGLEPARGGGGGGQTGRQAGMGPAPKKAWAAAMARCTCVRPPTSRSRRHCSSRCLHPTPAPAPTPRPALKQVRILREMAKKGEVPLRPGVPEFLDDALADGARVAVVACTASVPDDGLVSNAMLNLGPNRWVARRGRMGTKPAFWCFQGAPGRGGKRAEGNASAWDQESGWQGGMGGWLVHSGQGCSCS